MFKVAVRTFDSDFRKERFVNSVAQLQRPSPGTPQHLCSPLASDGRRSRSRLPRGRRVFRNLFVSALGGTHPEDQEDNYPEDDCAATTLRRSVCHTRMLPGSLKHSAPIAQAGRISLGPCPPFCTRICPASSTDIHSAPYGAGLLSGKNVVRARRAPASPMHPVPTSTTPPPQLARNRRCRGTPELHGSAILTLVHYGAESCERH